MCLLILIVAALATWGFGVKGLLAVLILLLIFKD